jgi:serine/threonine-protein kinase
MSLVGTVLAQRYRIDWLVASGGFGAIYRAADLIDRRDVALKVLHARLTRHEDVVARFRREAAVLVHLHSPHTVTAYDFGEADDGTLYIAMELLQGESLLERYRALGSLPWRRVLAIAKQVCGALSEAHAHGIVHRDLKPTNIHLAHGDFVKVLDFGIAKILRGSDLDDDELTHSGQMIGTFDYMAPEQMIGSACTPQTDLYTLGLVIYEMIAGVRPFGPAPSLTAMLQAMIMTVPTAPSAISDAPIELDAVINKLLQRDPVQRYARALDLANALDDVLAIPNDTLREFAVPDLLATLPGVMPPKRS